VKPPSWLTDTIARRFVLTQILTVGATLGLVLLFNLLGGVWAQDPLNESGLLNEVNDMVRLIEAAPLQMRPSLASAATSGSRRVFWFAAGSEVAGFLDTRREHDRDVEREVSGDTHHISVTMHHPNLKSAPAALPLGTAGSPEYLLAVRLQDRSWTVFATPNRMWGASQSARWSIRLIFLAASISVITALAARRFARPMKVLAAAVHEFGVNPLAPAIPESGPRQLSQVIRTFNEMQAQIQQFLANRTMMLAAISHDLRTPLTRMRLRGEFIQDTEQQARLFRDVDEMQIMVDGALAFFRDDAMTEPTTTFDLPKLLMTIANDYANREIDVAYRGPAHAVYRGRPLALKRAVNNLVENAIRFATPPEIELLREERAFVVVIRDRGPGIPDSAMGSVFLPYSRVEKSRNRYTGGVGLGLTVAQSIVHGHGGEIALRNCVEGGLEVRISLPLTGERALPFPLSVPRAL
jgi:signal transduction histidine kinase